MKREFNSVIFFGDSICAGYGVSDRDSFPFLLRETGIDVVNLSVSGGTTVDMINEIHSLKGLEELENVFIMLGFNDILNGASVLDTINSLKKLILEIKELGFNIIVGVYPDFNLDELIGDSVFISHGIKQKFYELQRETMHLINEMELEFIDYRNAINKETENYEDSFFDGLHLSVYGNKLIHKYNIYVLNR